LNVTSDFRARRIDVRTDDQQNYRVQSIAWVWCVRFKSRGFAYPTFTACFASRSARTCAHCASRTPMMRATVRAAIRAHSATLGGRLGAVIGSLPPPTSFATLRWCGEHAPVLLAT